MDMEETLIIFGIEIDNQTSKESMKSAIALMEREGLGTIELVTMEMLLQEQDNQELKQIVRAMDLVLPGTKEILEMADFTEKEARSLQYPSERPFLQLFMKFLQKNQKRIFVLAESEMEKEMTVDLLLQGNKGILIAGSGILSKENASEDTVVNDINGLEIDCILSVVPSPQQEQFIAHSAALLNANIWLGCGNLLRMGYKEKQYLNRVKNFVARRIFHHQVGKQNDTLH
ncbi:MAG: teichoic acid biosynthesis protein [Hespellia sp.]|nr:teichoic acid biosynthesis protein [Hespellia sp.]